MDRIVCGLALFFNKNPNYPAMFGWASNIRDIIINNPEAVIGNRAACGIFTKSYKTIRFISLHLASANYCGILLV